ncbi:uncharacterized protein LOC122840201 [Gambusia affinis]|uniref:uncharacterized protein LOC122840201 n=1 Tax=Gambusia affinis TaxID=33528 RepID=UPI001CDC9C7B|nr:uncharacterized protein LOC122840201 [Gambusia affinis]XP_043988374.1 uncharacterized protein LOC122840201 [Gambusia affinis]XP_043988375.1 uncharacterized protein LOC122840201 [Gambusia affinis]
MSNQSNHCWYSTPISIGRGRGVLAPIPFSVDSPAPSGLMASLDEIPSARVHNPVDCYTRTPMPNITPTPNPTSDSSECVTAQMKSVIQEIGHQLADSIISRIQPHNTVAPSSTATQTVASIMGQSGCVSDVSQVQVVMQRKVKEPPCFAGNGSDSITVHDWEDQMRTFIRKSNVKIEEQADEILMHLRGKAKDVVKFGIRNSNINITAHPDMIFSLLRKHFSSTKYSAVPLADFYSTLPKDHEDPYDYWLRLNRAADFASDCLREQGKLFENPEMEVTRMFIRNCPCKDLTLTFRSKTIDKWSACEVLEVLNEYHAEVSCKETSPVHHEKTVDIKVHKAEVGHGLVPTHNSQEYSQTHSPQCVSLTDVMFMLEKVLLHGASDQSHVRRRTPPRRPVDNTDKIDGFTIKPCIICKADNHSALSHCRENRLCFKCYAPGHSRHNCPTKRAAPEHQEN